MRPPSRPAAPLELRQGVALAPLTTLGIGGPARWFLEASSVEQVRQGLAWAAGEALPVMVLGGGSNVLIADQGFPGMVIRIALGGVEQERHGEDLLLRAGAGEEWDGVVAQAVAAGAGGIECLSGIPGFTGATPVQNVGAYGQEVSDTLVELEAMSRQDGTVRRFTAEDCRFGYRRSVFKQAERDRWVVLAVTYRLRPGAEGVVRYPELARFLAEGGGRRDLAAVRQAVLTLRRRKGMVIDPADPDTRSDGSFFVNPVLPDERVEAFFGRVRAAGLSPEQVPRFPAPGGVKLSAAWLIEQAGFAKGYGHGRVGLSSKHALAIVNRGGGTAAEVGELVAILREGVASRFGVELEPEPVLVGFAPGP